MIKSELFNYPKKELLETIVYGYSFSPVETYRGVYIGYNSVTERYIIQGKGLHIFYAEIITEKKESILAEVVAKTVASLSKDDEKL